MSDIQFLEILRGHGVSDLSTCFVLRDKRTGGHSVGMFNAAGKPFILIDDDDEFNDDLVQFLKLNGVSVFADIADLSLQ